MNPSNTFGVICSDHNSVILQLSHLEFQNYINILSYSDAHRIHDLNCQIETLTRKHEEVFNQQNDTINNMRSEAESNILSINKLEVDIVLWEAKVNSKEETINKLVEQLNSKSYFSDIQFSQLKAGNQIIEKLENELKSLKEENQALVQNVAKIMEKAEKAKNEHARVMNELAARQSKNLDQKVEEINRLLAANAKLKAVKQQATSPSKLNGKNEDRILREMKNEFHDALGIDDMATQSFVDSDPSKVDKPIIFDVHDGCHFLHLSLTTYILIKNLFFKWMKTFFFMEQQNNATVLAYAEEIKSLREKKAELITSQKALMEKGHLAWAINQLDETKLQELKEENEFLKRIKKEEDARWSGKFVCIYHALLMLLNAMPIMMGIPKHELNIAKEELKKLAISATDHAKLNC